MRIFPKRRTASETSPAFARLRRIGRKIKRAWQLFAAVGDIAVGLFSTPMGVGGLIFAAVDLMNGQPRHAAMDAVIAAIALGVGPYALVMGVKATRRWFRPTV